MLAVNSVDHHNIVALRQVAYVVCAFVVKVPYQNTARCIDVNQCRVSARCVDVELVLYNSWCEHDVGGVDLAVARHIYVLAPVGSSHDYYSFVPVVPSRMKMPRTETQ